MELTPIFRRKADGQLLLSDTHTALLVRQEGRNKQYQPPKKGEDVRKEAYEAVRAAGGDTSNQKHVLAHFRVQFGAFRGETFLWLLENSPGYAAWMAIEAAKEQPSASANWINKMALKKYMELFEEGREMIQLKRKERAKKAKPQAEEMTDLELIQAAESIERDLTGSTDLETRSLPISGQPEQSVPVQSSQHWSASTDTLPQTGVQQTQPSAVEYVHPPKISSESVQVDVVEPNTEQSSLSISQGEQSHLSVSQILQPVTSASEVLLYQDWRHTLPKVDYQWVSSAFFRLNAKNKIEFKMEKAGQLWHYPPQPSLSPNNINKIDRYFAHRLFLWMPLTVWGVLLHCPHTVSESSISCQGILTRAGMYQKTRIVLDIDCYYILATEYLRCSTCGRKLPAWAHIIVNQLDQDKQLMFPCILTAKYACDKRVVELLRHRGLGNSSSMVRKQLQETHGERHLMRVHHYLTNQSLKQSQVGRFVSTTSLEEPPLIVSIPDHRWLMKVYQLDVLHRLDFIKASVTSLFGMILKLDSTKKITKKLAGRGAKTAMWATNVGNEYGQVIMSVLTTNEGQGLSNMISGLCRRYKLAEVAAPRLLYVDRDCCGSGFVGKYFDWPYLTVRLDVWHFMRRLSIGCTTDAHPLYGVFMARLSQCIFQWEEEDLKLLKKAKQAQLLQQHIPSPSDAEIVRRIKKDELALHCRRRTRGAVQTTALISQLIQSMEGDKGLDILGVPLFDSTKMNDIWAKQSHHVACIQDPEGVQLYTKMKTVKKGGVELPVFRCARGSTSLESFHLHMNRFIPGTLAGDVNFQVYLLDGIHRWNQDRQIEALEGLHGQEPLSYDGTLRHSVNKLGRELLQKDFCPDFTLPRKYTGELIGLEYLYSQSTQAVKRVEYDKTAVAMENDSTEEDVGEEDEGFEESEALDDLTIPSLEPLPTLPAVPKPVLKIPTDEEYRQMIQDTPHEESILIGESNRTPSTQKEQSEPAPVQRLQPSAETSDQPNLCHSPAKEHQIQKTDAALEVVEQGKPVQDDSDIGPDNVPGYSAVIRLATCLAKLREQEGALSSEQADEIIHLWDGLSDFDKSRTRFPERFQTSPTSGRFRSKQKQVAPGVISIERAILGPNATRANWPNCNRYVEQTVEQLVASYPSDRRIKTKSGSIKSTTRWTLIKEAYANIQKLVINNRRIMDRTELQLPSLNNKTIQQWYNKKGKDRDLQILLQGIEKVHAPMAGTGAPAPKQRPATLQTGSVEAFQFNLPPDTSGMAKLSLKKKTSTAAMVADVEGLPEKRDPKTTSIRPILPKTFLPLVSLTSPSTVVQPTALSIIPSVAALHQSQTGQKRKQEEQAGPRKKVTCPKCRQPRVQPLHRQYMGFWWCGTTNPVQFEEWRADLVSRGVARKHKRSVDQ